MLADQLRQLLALLRQKHPPILLVVVTVLTIAVSVLTQVVGIVGPSVHTTTVIERAPAPAAAALAQTLPVACTPPPNSPLGYCAAQQHATAVSALGTHLVAGAASLQTIHGPLCVDVSSNNRHPIDWHAAARNIACGFVKVTEGPAGHGPYVNPYAAGDCAALKAVGKPRSGYDFARPQTGWTGADEAHWFYAHAGPCLGSLPSVLDVEATRLSAAGTRAWVHQYIVTVRHLSGRVDFIVYTGAWFWNPNVGGPSLGTYLWVSGYASSVINPVSWHTHLCWQYTDGVYGPYPHVISGIGHVDVSVCDAKLLARLDQARGPTPAEIAKRKHAAELRAARRSHRIVHSQIHRRCRGRHADHHSAGCRVLFRRNALLHAKYGKALG